MGLRNWLLAGSLLLVPALAGCGGGGGSAPVSAPVTTKAPAPLTKEEVISQGDAICAEVNAAVGTMSSTESGATSTASQVAQLYSGMIERLKGLGTPSDAAGYPEFISSGEELAQAERNAALAAERGEESSLVSAEGEASSALTSFQSAAQSYGFKDCSEGPSAPPTSAAPSQSPSEETGGEAVEEEPAPEPEPAPETGGAGTAEGGGEGGGAGAGAETAGGGTGGGGSEGTGGSSGGIGPG
jgi:uncharacterized membrane protein YgcG